MKKLSLLLALFTLSPIASAAPSQDALDGLSDDPIDLKLDLVSAQDVLLVLGSVAEVELLVDDCVDGELSLALQGVTLRTVFETVGDMLALSYHRIDERTLEVGCLDVTDGDARRVDVELVDVPLGDVLQVLGDGSSMTWEGCEDVRVDVAAHNAQPHAVLRQIAAQANARVEQAEGGVHIVCERRAPPGCASMRSSVLEYL